jgi:Tannase and feruloyl esterase
MGQAQTNSFVRLYMVPGMQHCGGGPGTDMFGQSGREPFDDPQRNVRVALEQWVESGKPPSTIIAARAGRASTESAPAMTRPLCPYPLSAKYKGSGDTNHAESFVCASADK